MSARDAGAEPIDAVAFVREPARYAHPGRLAAALGGEPSERVVTALAGSDRLRPRLAEAIEARFGLAPCRVDDLAGPVERLALLPTSRIVALVELAGSLCHAAALRLLVTRTDVDAFEEVFGSDPLARALAFAGPTLPVDPSRSVADLVAAVQSSAHDCLAVWYAELPAGVRDRVRIRFADEPGPPTGPEPELEIARSAIVHVALEEHERAGHG